jgi:hypothetical protein
MAIIRTVLGKEPDRCERNVLQYLEENLKKVDVIYGKYSKLPMNLSLDSNDGMYPSCDHVIEKDEERNHGNMVVDGRVINDMKTIFTEKEFFKIVSHLHYQDCKKSIECVAKPVSPNWSPYRKYEKKKNEICKRSS